MKLTARQKQSLADLNVNLATAWLVGGWITPFFNQSTANNSFLPKLVIALVISAIFLYSSLRIQQ